MYSWIFSSVLIQVSAFGSRSLYKKIGYNMCGFTTTDALMFMLARLAVFSWGGGSRVVIS